MNFNIRKTLSFLDYTAKYIGAFGTSIVMYTLASILIHPIVGFCALWWLLSVYFDVSFKKHMDDIRDKEQAKNIDLDEAIKSVFNETK